MFKSNNNATSAVGYAVGGAVTGSAFLAFIAGVMGLAVGSTAIIIELALIVTISSIVGVTAYSIEKAVENESKKN